RSRHVSVDERIPKILATRYRIHSVTRQAAPMTIPDQHPGPHRPDLSDAATVITGHGGNRLVADVGGPADGPAVALLHGGGQTRHSWAGTWRYLTDRGWRGMSVD